MDCGSPSPVEARRDGPRQRHREHVLVEVGTALTRSQVEGLPTYDETATYHLASVGWLRKHLGWKQDAKSDEEPG